MRHDMFKVIVERPRLKGWSKVKTGGSTALSEDSAEELPTAKISLKRDAIYKTWYGGKDLNENLMPLKRFFRSKVGCLWNKVFSEVCQNLPLDSTVKRHVRQHISDFVATNCWMAKSGKIMQNSQYGVIELFKDFYVLNTDGILRYKQRSKKFKYKEAKTVPTVEANKQKFVLVDNIWYELAQYQQPAKLGYWWSGKEPKFCVMFPHIRDVYGNIHTEVVASANQTRPILVKGKQANKKQLKVIRRQLEEAN